MDESDAQGQLPTDTVDLYFHTHKGQELTLCMPNVSFMPYTCHPELLTVDIKRNQFSTVSSFDYSFMYTVVILCHWQKQYSDTDMYKPTQQTLHRTIRQISKSSNNINAASNLFSTLSTSCLVSCKAAILQDQR